MAERVGFVPDVPAPLNDLGRIGTARNRQISGNLSIWYKTGTAQLTLCLLERVRSNAHCRATPAIDGRRATRWRVGPRVQQFFGRRLLDSVHANQLANSLVRMEMLHRRHQSVRVK